MADKLEELLAKRAALDARIRKEQNKAKKTKRQIENRKKFLSGQLAMKLMKRSEEFSMRFMQELDKDLVRDDERALFNFTSRRGSGKVTALNPIQGDSGLRDLTRSMPELEQA